MSFFALAWMRLSSVGNYALRLTSIPFGKIGLRL